MAQTSAIPSSQKVYYRPAEQEEHNHTSPKDPLILPRSPLHHANRISTDPQRARHVIQPPLRALQHVTLRAQVAQHRAPALEILIELRIRLRKERLLPQRMGFARGLLVARAERQATVGAGRRERGLLRERGRDVGVLRGAGLVGAAAEELGAVVPGLGVALGALEGVKAAAVVLQLGAEGLGALARLLLLRRVELVLGLVGVLVNGAGEGGEGRGDLACSNFCEPSSCDGGECMLAYPGARPGVKWARKPRSRGRCAAAWTA